MSQWFRFYNNVVHDPKVQRLPGEKFKSWVNLLCLAADNDGVLPSLQDIAFVLRMGEEEVSSLLNEFCERELLDPVEVVDAPMSYEPHNWGGRQFKSDTKDPTAADRNRRYRERKRNDRNDTVSLTPTRAETEQNRTEQKDSVGSIERDEQFARFWKAYPERKGANPKKPARDVFFAKLKTGIDAEAIIAGAIACSVRDRDKIGTPYIPQAVKWLRDERWVDYQAQAPPQKDWRTLLRLYTSDTPGRRGNWMWGKGEPGQPGCEVPPDIQREFGFEPFNGASP